MICDRSLRPSSFAFLLRCWERRIGLRLNEHLRAFDPVEEEISLRLRPNDHLEAPCQRMTSHRSLVLAVHTHLGSASQRAGA